jgi:glycosyltransferase involved in cell wall biosynthesis
MLGYYLSDKGFELGLDSFISTLRESNARIKLTVIVSLRERFGSARMFSARDRRDFENFQSRLLKARAEFPENIDVFGFLTDDELTHVIESSDYLLMPYSSITNSGVAVTAKAHGIPVISSDLKPLMEAFGIAGIYFESGSALDLTAKLKLLVENPNWSADRKTRSTQMVEMANIDSVRRVAVSIVDTQNS